MCICSLSYSACRAHVPYCYPWPVWLHHIFPHYLTKGTTFGEKNVTECRMWVLIFSAAFVWNISYSGKNKGTCYHKCICIFMCMYLHVYVSSCICIFMYTGCPGRNMPDFGRMFLKLKYTDLTQNTYIRSWTVTEIMAREKCGLLAVPRTVPGSRDVLHCACPSFSLQPTQAYSRCDCTCKMLGTLRTTATLVRVFM